MGKKIFSIILSILVALCLAMTACNPTTTPTKATLSNQTNVLNLPILPNNQAAYGTETITTAGANLTMGQVCYMGNDSKFYPAPAINNPTSIIFGMALSNTAVNTTGMFLLNGVVRNDAWAWTVGQGNLVFSSNTTSGNMTQLAPGFSGNQLQVLGVPIATNVIYFNPNTTYLASTQVVLQGGNATLSNVTVTNESVSGTDTIGTANITAMTGVYSGTTNMTAATGTAIVSLAMSGTPSIITLTFAGNPGNSTSTLYTLPATNNSTAFEIYATTNVTNNVTIAYRVTVGTGK